MAATVAFYVQRLTSQGQRLEHEGKVFYICNLQDNDEYTK